jgi:quinol monooxygenase YgiN
VGIFPQRRAGIGSADSSSFAADRQALRAEDAEDEIMIDANIKITVPPGKRNEFLQTFREIIGLIRREHGCLSCHCYVDIEEEEIILFKGEWKTLEDLEKHFESIIFFVLIGAMNLLEKRPDIRINTISSTINQFGPSIERISNGKWPLKQQSNH